MRSSRRKSNLPPPPQDLPEEVIGNILSRLPGKYVLRCRAVSKVWRRITSDPHFLAAHARRQPLELVLCTLLERRPCAGDADRYIRDLALDSIPVTATNPDDQRRLIRLPDYVTETPSYVSEKVGLGHLPIASCAGVLLFRMVGELYLICNPVTRQWTELPRLPRGGIHREYGFYFHQSSREYRLLSRFKYGQMAKYYITSTGASEPRQVSPGDIDAIGLIGYYDTTPVALQDRLHWMFPLSAGHHNIVAFDTVSEMFHLMMPAPPISSEAAKLFGMNQSLAAANFGETHIDLWFLEDYDAREWVHRHRIVTQSMLTMLGGPQCNGYSKFWRITAASDNAEDIVLGTTGNLMVYNVRTKTVRGLDFICESNHGLRLRYLFRESLMPLGAARPSAGDPEVQFG